MTQGGRLILICGPSCSGKSTLIAGIREGAHPRLCEQLGIADPREWIYTFAKRIPGHSPSAGERMVLHYEFCAQRMPGGYRHLLDLTRRFDETVLLTLWADSRVLARRLRRRILRISFQSALNPANYGEARIRLRRLWRLWSRLRMFRDAGRLLAEYRDWLEYSEKLDPVSHWILENSRPGADEAELLEEMRDLLPDPRESSGVRGSV